MNIRSNNPMHFSEQHVMKYYPSNITFEDSPIISEKNLDIQTEYDLGFTFLVHNMDRDAINVFTRLINTESEAATALALKLASLYNN